ncbi:type VII secretion protein EccC [Corynebacterium doosanense]|uniref:type VII secretion protein EccC n=1 Tax=Corynebacterium doosanense TaxID=1121358 RepID=UPI00056E4451|nr:type VII secretion protein EccC [Corynebacterium doosanense]
MPVTFGTVVEPLMPGEREPAPPKPSGTLNVEAVPPAQRPQPMPVVRILMPVIMVAAMVAMVAVMFAGGRGASPMTLVLPLMMGVSMLMMFSPPQTEGEVDETRRAYLRHLGIVREKALADAHLQRLHELHRHPGPADLESRIGSRRMWERGEADSDAMEVRIGLGDALLSTALEVRDGGATEDLEPVCAVSLRRTLQAISTVGEMPIIIQLRAFRFLALSGPAARPLARAMIAQLVSAHGPEVVGVQVVGEREGGAWEWLKWLPHSRQPQRARFPVLVVDDVATTGTEDFIDDASWACVLDVASRPAASALALRAESEGLALQVDEDISVLTASGVESLGVPDGLTDREAVLFARSMAAYMRPSTGGNGTRGDLLSLVGIGDIDDLAPETMWPLHGQARSRLTAPIGLSEAGGLVRLDLKEAAHGGMGPHGLCIGATGSGKSELLRTLVTALAATHSPEELNLVLVDFKGGATFLGCEGLPHTSAVITNLEEEAVLVDRMYDAVSGELNRRQEALRSAGNFANVTDYALARSSTRPDLPALPSLVIIVDEFSELLVHHPDFADLFVAVGRLGRSLGVHLLLASQRLEEGKLRGLDSHLSYRISLKTFSAGESRQVIGVPDAYHLPAQPGAGFLRTDADALTRFQAAYVSGPLPRRDSGSRHRIAVPEVSLFTAADEIDEVGEKADNVRLDQSITVLDAIVEAAREAAAVRELAAHRIWLDPLPARIELSSVVRPDGAGTLRATIGIIDRPYHQRQDPLELDLSESGGHVAVSGGPQTGKTGTLRTLAAALAAGHSTDEVRFYVIDLGDGGLSQLERLPHVAGYAGRGDDEKIRRIIDEVTALVDLPEPRHTFLFIDGWHAIATTGSDLDDLVDVVSGIAADGPGARVHLVISTPRWATLRPAIRDLITHRIELRLVDALDSVIDRKAQEKLPAAPGRGLSADGAHMLVAFTSGQDLEHIRREAQSRGQQSVPALRVLPTSVDVSQLAAAETPGVPIGIGGARLTTLTWDPVADAHLVIVGASQSGKSAALRTVMSGICRLGRERARLVVVDPRRSHLGELPDEMVAAYAASASAAAQTLRSAVTTLRDRLPGPDISPAELRERSWWTGPDIYIAIDDLDLVAAAELHLLSELLPFARDIGLHLVVARKSGGIGRAMFGGMLAALHDEQPAALILSADRDDGPIFGIRPKLLPPGRATWVTRGVNRGACHVALTQEVSLP